jgi:hypothetical protein
MTASKAKTAQQRAYAAKQEKLAELQKVANAATRKATREWRAKNPEHADLDVKVMNFSYVRNKKAVSKAILEIAQRMTWPSNADKKQVEIVRDVQPLFPELNLRPTIWQKALSQSMMKKVEPVINGNLPKAISLKGCNTLSKIRKKIKTARHAAAGAPHTFKATITFSREAVVIGKASYKLEMRTSKGHKYPCIRVPVRGTRCWVRMDGLVAALKKT